MLSIGLPLLVCGFPALRLWMGNTYAIRSLSYLRILALANIIRYLTYPYIVMVVAGGRQRAAYALTGLRKPAQHRIEPAAGKALRSS